MADREVFAQWSDNQLLEYIRENGGSTQYARNKDDLITEALRLARRAEESRFSGSGASRPGPGAFFPDPAGVQGGGAPGYGAPGSFFPSGGPPGAGGPYAGGPYGGPPPYPPGPPPYGGPPGPPRGPPPYGAPPGPPRNPPYVPGPQATSTHPTPGVFDETHANPYQGGGPGGAANAAPFSQQLAPYQHGPPQGFGQYGMQGVAPPMPPAGGRKKALVVGINYLGSRNQLGGCINDAKCMEYLLRKRFGFTPDSILIMTDDQRDPTRIPTKRNMLMGFEWLVTGMRSGDSLFFSYSGHGSQQPDYKGEEPDGMNETLCPLDFTQAGQIVDDDLNTMLVNPVIKGCKFHAVIDACHSGSVMDLPYSASIDRRLAGPSGQGAPVWRNEYTRPTRSYKGTAGGFVVQIGAAQDSQTAADTNKLSGNVSTGAATYAFIQAIERRGPTMSYGELLHTMDVTLHNALGSGGGGGVPALMPGSMGGLLGSLLGDAPASHETQRPQLSSCYTFDMNFKFSL